jgi:tetratricopeptide (TPR) repeat protein
MKMSGLSRLVGMLLLPFLVSDAALAQTPLPSPKKSVSAQSAMLTPQEKEAQKHYRIALEAIKNNDFSTASDELKTAADLAPKNALIWYNLAVVESKKGDSALALQHLQKAETLGLPKSLQNDADQLEAKLSYEVEKENKSRADEAKRKELSDRIHTALNGIGQQYSCSLNARGSQSGYWAITNDGTCSIRVDWNSQVVSDLRTNGLGMIWTRHYDEQYNFNLADALPDLSVLEKSRMFLNCDADGHWVVIAAKEGKTFQANVNYPEDKEYWEQGIRKSSKSDNDFRTVAVKKDVYMYFKDGDAARDAARRISDAIRLCSGTP